MRIACTACEHFIEESHKCALTASQLTFTLEDFGIVIDEVSYCSLGMPKLVVSSIAYREGE